VGAIEGPTMRNIAGPLGRVKAANKAQTISAVLRQTTLKKFAADVVRDLGDMRAMLFRCADTGSAAGACGQ
jgi:hypothetical protein